MSRELLGPDVVDRCLEMMQQGFRPVIVISDDRFILTSDIAAAHQMMNLTCIEQSFLVIPLAQSLCQLLDEAAEALTASQMFLPATVSETAGKKRFKRVFELDGQWGFTVEARGTAPSSKAKKPKSTLKWQP